jgi:hypothetical protein
VSKIVVSISPNKSRALSEAPPSSANGCNKRAGVGQFALALQFVRVLVLVRCLFPLARAGD